MSKIAGLVTDLPADEARVQLSLMMAAMVHGPSYTSGVCFVPQLGCYVGWVDPRGGNAEARVCRHEGRTLIFVGEHFEDRRQHHPDGAALLERYAKEGERCFRDLNGWFAGEPIDPHQEAVVLFNDRLGMHRLYYSQTSGASAFASEAKALLAIRPESRRIDPEGLGQFFAFGCQIGARTFFDGVSRLPGGAAWTLAPGKSVVARRYFTSDELEAQAVLDPEQDHARLEQVLSDAVPRHMADRDAVAVSLTGGFDTRAIMAFDDQSADRRLSYTYGGMYRDCYDVELARAIAHACGYDHQVLALDGAFLDSFADCAEETVWVTDGTLDVSASHEVYLSRLARAIAPVRVTGNYGSEVLRGVSLFKPLGLPREMFAREFVPYIEAGEAALEAARNTHPVSFAIFHEIPSSLYGRLAAAQSQLTVRTPYTDNALVALAYQAPTARHSVTECWTRLITARRQALADIPTDRGQLGTASALSSLAPRIYNHLLFKAEWYYEGGMPNWLSPVDAWLTRNRRPPFFAGTHKIQHYRLWFRDHLGDWADAMLNDSSSISRPYLNRGYASAIAAAHREGRRNCFSEISTLVTVELIHRLFIDEAGTRRFEARPMTMLQEA